MTQARIAEASPRDFLLTYLIFFVGVGLVVADLIWQVDWYWKATTSETLGMRTPSSHLESDGHLDSSTIPLLPYPETQEAFLAEIVLTCIYHVVMNLFTIAYWIQSSDSPYVKYGIEETFADANGERPQIFGKFLLVDLDKIWMPKYRFTSIVYWLVAPFLLRRHLNRTQVDPLFRMEANLNEDDPAEVDLAQVTERNPLYRLNKARMSISYQYFPVFSWTLFRFFWFFYLPPVTVLGHIRLAALLIAYNREMYTFGVANSLVTSGLTWTIAFVWLWIAAIVLVWFFVVFLREQVTAYWQRRNWIQRHRDNKKKLHSATTGSNLLMGGSSMNLYGSKGMAKMLGGRVSVDQLRTNGNNNNSNNKNNNSSSKGSRGSKGGLLTDDGDMGAPLAMGGGWGRAKLLLAQREPGMTAAALTRPAANSTPSPIKRNQVLPV